MLEVIHGAITGARCLSCGDTRLYSLAGERVKCKHDTGLLISMGTRTAALRKRIVFRQFKVLKKTWERAKS